MAPRRKPRTENSVKHWYTKTMEQVEKLVDWRVNRGLITTDDITTVNIRLLKEFAALHPVRVALDATDISAWVEQLPDQDTPEKERAVRRRAPGASYRVHKRKGIVVKRFRGYWLFVFVDVATNRPITWCLWPGGEEGASPKAALRFLLNDLYEKWGDDCPLEVIVADRAWDDAEAVEMCAINYGVPFDR